MQRRWTAVLLFPTLAQAAVPAAPPNALTAVDACIARLDADNADKSFEPSALHCPDLLPRLQSSEWAAWLPAGWQDGSNNLSVQALAALRNVVTSELALRTGAHTPQVALLEPMLADLAERNPPPRAWWERIRNRLRILFAPEPGRHANGYGWLVGHGSYSAALLEIVAYATFALVVILAGSIIVNEWRASVPRRRRSAVSGATRQSPPQRPPQLGWDDIERASANERPRMLLELIAVRLTATRRLPAAASLTVRELARAASLCDAVDRERLDELALTAEELRFAPCAPAPAGIARVLERGRELFERLGEPLAQASSRGEAA
jgi:hypothetical protein